jgi:hypothetical protein
MIGRLVTAGVVLAAMGASPAMAGSPFGPWLFKKACTEGNQTQCAVQVAIGDGNWARTEQGTNRRGSDQLAVTLQKGNDNIAYTGQVGKDQLSLTTQVGTGNAGYTYQNGSYNFTNTVQVGTGTWAASSSVGDGTYVSVVVTN